MYKSKLQILCQRNSWGLPEFSTAKCGEDHNPTFTATVTVNGRPFAAADGSRTSKEAQNKAAKIAFDHFSSPAVPPHPNFPEPPRSPASSGFDVGQLNTGISQPTMIGTIPTPMMSETLVGAKVDKKIPDMGHLYKNRLQNYAQKRNLPLPDYSTVHEGPPHAGRFKSMVRIDGKTYESPELFRTVKEAEHAAAKVALESLSINEVQKDDSGLFKNILQELAQKEGLDVPRYETKVSGPPHLRTFVSIVEIKGQSFEGQAAKSKKQAETNAAKVAYIDLQERKKLVSSGGVSLILSSANQINEALEASSSILRSVIPGDWQQSAGPKANLKTREERSENVKGVVSPGDLQQTAGPTANLVIREEQDKDYIAGHETNCSSNLTASNAEVNNHRASPSPPDSDLNAKRHRCSTSADIVYASLRDPFPSTCSSPEDGFPLPLVHSESSQNLTMDTRSETPLGAADGMNALPREKIFVYPHGPNVECPEGASVVPFSDDKWVAMKMSPSRN